jgi:tetratricopeptide (TPR) repeat protein
MLRLGMRVAEWATPQIKEWHAEKHINRTEGQRHLDSRNYGEAEKHLVAALAEKHSGKHRVQLFAQLAKAQLKQNKYAAAAESAKAGADLARASGDPASLCTALESLAEIQVAQGTPDAAIETLQSVERVNKQYFPTDLSRAVVTVRQRAKIQSQSGKWIAALESLNESVALAEQAWGPDHLEVAHMLSEIGSIHSKTGNHVEAQQMLQRALKIYRATSGFDSPEATEGLHSLAVSLEESGDLQGAASEYERFVSVRERQIGGNRKDVALAQVRLASLYIQSGRSSAARELLSQAITVLEINRDPGLRDALEILAVAEDQANRPKEAALWREKAARLSGVAS